MHSPLVRKMAVYELLVKIYAFEDLVVLCPFKRYCFSVTTHVALDSPDTHENTSEEMHCGKT